MHAPYHGVNCRAHASPSWAEAAEGVQKHVVRVTVTLLGGEADMLAKHILLTRLAAAVAATTNCASVYWGNSGVVHPLNGLSRSLWARAPVEPPIDLRLQPTSKATCRLFTTGLAAFNQLEIDVPHRKSVQAN